MNIAIDVSQMCYEGTGVARYVRGLTQALLAHDSSHHFILFAGALRQRSFFTKLAVTHPWNKAEWKIVPLPPKLAGLALNFLPIPFELLTGSADLIHASDWSEPSAQAPMVTTVHDLVFRKYPETVDPLILKTQRKRLARIVKNQTHIIADSLSTKNDLVKIYNLPKSRITVIYPGIDARYTPQSKKEIDRVKHKYHLPEKYYLSLGTQEPRKNLVRLVVACQTLEYPLVLTGKQGWGQQVKEQDHILSLGYVDEADLPGLYSGATVFIYPSLYEGFGFPVAEAMACGTPVVTSEISSLPEVGGSASVLVDPTNIESIRDGIIRAEKEQEKRRQAGLQQSKKFTWEKTAKQVLEVYEKITHRN